MAPFGGEPTQHRHGARQHRPAAHRQRLPGHRLALAHLELALPIEHLAKVQPHAGMLRFPEFGQQLYQPPAGGTVVFSCSLLHEATPVASGVRYAFLPFLYDDAAAKIRQENLRFVGAPEAPK